MIRLPAFRGLPLPGAGPFSCCRGCLGPMGAGAEAGLCGRCWEGLRPLPEGRCPACALVHGDACPEPVAWALGDALWDYHGGRPPLGALLVPGVKAGERGWREALLRRLAHAELPPWTADVDAVVPAPGSPFHRLRRGFDLAGEAAAGLAARLGRPCEVRLAKAWRQGRQAMRTESERRRLPQKAIRLRRGDGLEGRVLLLVDDVWTTGTTLQRCAQALSGGGAAEVRVLTLFRAM